MGAKPSKPLAQWSTDEVAAAVASIGSSFEPYKPAIQGNAVDGDLLASLAPDEMAGFYSDLAITSLIHQKKLSKALQAALVNSPPASSSSTSVLDPAANPPSQSSSSSSSSSTILLPSTPTASAPADPTGHKKFGAFLSHFKQECGSDARIVHLKMRALMPSVSIFLDSDDLFDLRALLEDVRASAAFVLFQSSGVLTRPWCLLEIHTAIKHGVPIVCLNIKGPNPYDYGAASSFMAHLGTELDRANPGALKLIEDNGVEIEEMAYLLSNTIPNCISVDFNPHGSSNTIKASMMDLIEAMEKADARPLSSMASMEEWLAKRGPPPRRRGGRGSARGGQPKEHGKALAASSDGSSGKATVPATVPELPSAYQVRKADLEQLKGCLLSSEGASTALTSTKKKVGAQGMGGVGKTTIAAALVQEEVIKMAFDKIVWVSLGHEPDIQELQKVIHHQLTKEELPESAKTQRDIMAALRDASTGQNVLLVLDDVWDASDEKPLNCIDMHTESRLLVTTRIRGLLENSADVELGVLSESEAMAMLLRYAGIGSLDNESEEHQQALEIVKLCACLPLTLAIAGGMVAANGGLAQDIVEVMKTDLGKQLMGEGGMTVEERVIASSLKMIDRHPQAVLIKSIFKRFAVFPEDIPVPRPIFDVLAPSFFPDAATAGAATTAMARCISELLNYNLLKGSFSTENGVFMHDIVRDFVIHQHSDDELRSEQMNTVELLLCARPSSGFRTAAFTAPSTLEGYVARRLSHHIKGSLKDNEMPEHAWLAHRDDAVVLSVALGLGRERMDSLSAKVEAAGQLVIAARLSMATALLALAGRLSVKEEGDYGYKAVELLEQAGTRHGGGGCGGFSGGRRVNDEDTRLFEMKVLSVAMARDTGSDRHAKAGARHKLLLNPPPTMGDRIAARLGGCIMASPTCQRLLVWLVARQARIGSGQEATFESKLNEASSAVFGAFSKWGFLGGPHSKWPNPTTQHREEALLEFRRAYSLLMEARELTEDPIAKAYCVIKTCFYGAMCCLVYPTDQDAWKMSDVVTEIQIVDAIASYDFASHSPYYKSTGKLDVFLWGGHMFHIVLDIGNLSASDVWARKTTSAFHEINFASTRNYSAWVMELFIMWTALPIFIMIDRPSVVADITEAAGLEWDDIGFELCFPAIKASNPDHDYNSYKAHLKMMLIVCDTEDEIDPAEANAFMPTPATLAQYEREGFDFREWGAYHLLGLGARAFLKLGRDDDAYETARIAVSPEQQTRKKTTLVDCHSILGQIAAKRGDLDEAASHFSNALKQAELSRLPMLEVLAARDWKKHLLEPNGRDTKEAEAAIDAACAKMKKSRERLGAVLLV